MDRLDGQVFLYGACFYFFEGLCEVFLKVSTPEDEACATGSFWRQGGRCRHI